VALIRGDGGEALAVPGDIGNEKDVMGLIRAAKDTFGALDIAVNNAAIEGTLEQMTELSHKDFAATLETNVVGTFLCLKYELAAMGDGGAIVNVSSVNAVRAEPTAAAYCASKAAVESLTKTAALEAGPRGIRVNALRAGFFLTAMHDRSLEAAGGASPQLIEEVEGLVALRRRGDPREAAGTIAWLCSDDASYVTGSVVTADGGLTAT
jgi:NAD(P)-dependent dehydrogenase (short-subunit alcohol dehydrogenase family)